MAKKNAQVNEPTEKTYSGGLKRVRGPLTQEIQLRQESRQDAQLAAKTAFKQGPHPNDPVVNRRPVKTRMGEQSDASDKRA